MVNSNVTTIELTGTEQEVRFSLKYPYFWCNNLSDTPVLMSKQSGIAEGADGVVIVPAGGTACTMHGYTDDVVYVSGTGKVQVMGTYSAFNPFKVAPAAGSGGGSTGQNYITQMGYVTKGSSAKTTVQFETPFSEPPYVFLTAVSTNGNTNSHVEIVSATTTEFTVNFSIYEGTNWVAFGKVAD